MVGWLASGNAASCFDKREKERREREEMMILWASIKYVPKIVGFLAPFPHKFTQPPFLRSTPFIICLEVEVLCVLVWDHARWLA